MSPSEWSKTSINQRSFRPDMDLSVWEDILQHQANQKNQDDLVKGSQPCTIHAEIRSV